MKYASLWKLVQPFIIEHRKLILRFQPMLISFFTFLSLCFLDILKKIPKLSWSMELSAEHKSFISLLDHYISLGGVISKYSIQANHHSPSGDESQFQPLLLNWCPNSIHDCHISEIKATKSYNILFASFSRWFSLLKVVPQSCFKFAL